MHELRTTTEFCIFFHVSGWKKEEEEEEKRQYIVNIIKAGLLYVILLHT